ncbi:MAG TPA: phasin family protein [Azospirillum sp.]|nr:phasin family protein [Azospirillum sp.]
MTDFQTKTFAQTTKLFDELTVATKANMDAAVQSGTIVAKGAEEATKRLAAFAQGLFQDQLATGKSLMGIKSFQELSNLQLALAKRTLDSAIAEANGLTELSVKVATEAAAPVAARMNAVAKMAA